MVYLHRPGEREGMRFRLGHREGFIQGVRPGRSVGCGEGFSEAFWDSEWLGVDESEEEALVRLSERGERGVLQLPLWISEPEVTRWNVLRVGSICRFDG